MRFPLTAEQEALQARARALADQEFRERAARWDEREEYPWDNVKQLVEAGLMGMSIPAAYGGQGRALLDVILVIEQVARVCGVTGRLLVDSNRARSEPSSIMAPEAQNGSTCPASSGGTSRPSPSPSSRAGSAASDLETRAERDGDAWRLTGTKRWITGAGISQTYVVLCRFDPHPRTGGDRCADRRRRDTGPHRHPAGAGDGNARDPRGRGGIRSVPGARRRSPASPPAGSSS